MEVGGPAVLVVVNGDADLGRTSFGVHPSEGARTVPMSLLCWERRFLVFSFPPLSTCYGCAVLPSVCSRGSEWPLRQRAPSARDRSSPPACVFPDGACAAACCPLNSGRGPPPHCPGRTGARLTSAIHGSGSDSVMRHSVLAVGDGASSCSLVGCLYAHLQWPAPHSEEGRDLVLALEPRDQCRASSCQLPARPAHEPRACMCPGLNRPRRLQAGGRLRSGCTSWLPPAAVCLARRAGWPRPEQPWQCPWAEGAEEAQDPACSLPSLRTIRSSVPWFALGAQRALVLTRTVSVSLGPLGVWGN